MGGVSVIRRGGYSLPLVLVGLLVVLSVVIAHFYLDGQGENINKQMDGPKTLQYYSGVQKTQTPATKGKLEVKINPVTGQKDYKNNKYQYQLTFPENWNLEGDTTDIELFNGETLSSSSGVIYLRGSLGGIGCYFFGSSNLNLNYKNFTVNGRTVTLKDDCFPQKYLSQLETENKDTVYLDIIARTDQDYREVYEILDKSVGLSYKNCTNNTSSVVRCP